MTALRIDLGPTTATFCRGEERHEVPVGSTSLAASIAGDPPDPADLSNAIGLVLDHLDDVARALPGAGADGIEFAGASALVVAAVEVGAAPALPFRLRRHAAEEVFRTLATEVRADRARNPGLPAEWVNDVLGACCWLVGVMRHFDVDDAVVVG